MKHLIFYLLNLFFLSNSLFCLESLSNFRKISFVPNFTEDYNGWLYTDNSQGHWLDNRQGFTTLGLFLPISALQTAVVLPFLNMQAHWFQNGQSASNLGGGLRFSRHSKIIGINAFYDSRSVSWHNKVHQFGIGFEILGQGWDLRGNGYAPISKRKFYSTTCHFDYPGGYQASNQQNQSSMPGFDVEIGKWIYRNSIFQLYGALGLFSYFPGKEKKKYQGGSLRILTNFGSFVSFEVQGGYDQASKGMVQGKISITLPLYTSASQNHYNFIYQPIYRQDIIALTKKNCCWHWNW